MREAVHTCQKQAKKKEADAAAAAADFFKFFKNTFREVDYSPW